MQIAQPATGISLKYTFHRHTAPIGRLAWSPNRAVLASPSRDKTIRIWNAKTGKLIRTLKEEISNETKRILEIHCVAWSLDGRILASGSSDNTVKLWNVKTGKLIKSLVGHIDEVTDIAWSPTANILATSSDDRTIRIWDVDSSTALHTLNGHLDWVTSLAWRPDSGFLYSGSADGTIRSWNIGTGESERIISSNQKRVTDIVWSKSGRLMAFALADNTIGIWDAHFSKTVTILEGHSATVRSLSFSSNDRLLASKSWDGTVALWRCETWEMIMRIPESSSGNWAASLSFHPKMPILASLGENDTAIRIWDIDYESLFDPSLKTDYSLYANAKVVLMGDAGVGKSGLGLTLCGQRFVATESTHNRNVWIFDAEKVRMDDNREEIREILLWDLAGQPSYRLVHQLHLNDIAIALVVFDGQAETDAFAGVRYWNRAIMQAYRKNSSLPLKKFLVAARVDRGGVNISRERVEAIMQELKFDAYFETSAKEGWQTKELAQSIHEGINWNTLTKVSSNTLFQKIKEYLIAEKESGRILSTTDDLRREFRIFKGDFPTVEDLDAKFITCIGLIESRGLIRRLSFGGLVLLQPELLDSYASSLIIAAKDDPDGLGCIEEENARNGRFRMLEHQRISGEQEKLLLIATVEDLLSHEIALREYSEQGVFLVFPSHFVRESPELSEPTIKSIVYSFEGPTLNIYSTLAVRLSHSGLFTKKAMWKNAAEYNAIAGGTCGIHLHETQEGYGELTIFFDLKLDKTTQLHFSQYIRTHLERYSLPGTVSWKRIYFCPDCKTPINDLAVSRRRERGYEWISCNVCEKRIDISYEENQISMVKANTVIEMDNAASLHREKDTAKYVLDGKVATSDFDVFLCHNSQDKPVIKKIALLLKRNGILPWLDEWELRPGMPWQRILEKQIKKIKSVAIFIGKNGIGPWQDLELAAFIRQFVRRGCPVIPVILKECEEIPEIPLFLEGMTWVDLRKTDPNPIENLIWGVTGERHSVIDFEIGELSS